MSQAERGRPGKSNSRRSGLIEATSAEELTGITSTVRCTRLDAIFGRLEVMLEASDPEEAQPLVAAILTALAIGKAQLP